MGNKSAKSKLDQSSNSTSNENAIRTESDSNKITNDDHVEQLPPPEQGEVDIGDYRITVYPSLGSGAFGTVCEALYKPDKKKAAAKGIKIASQGRWYKEQKATAQEEGDIMKRVSHPNIVQLYEYFEHKDTVWLLMEFCSLGDLDKYLETYPDLSFKRKVQIMRETSSAIYHLHKNSPQIIHRDIKPQNILMTEVGGKHVAKLSDFGYAKLYDHSLSQSGSAFYTSMKGTACYMAPEFFLYEVGELKYNSSVDIFSLGLVCFVIKNYSPSNKSTFPVSALTRKMGRKAVFGRELADAHRAKNQLPTLIEVSGENSKLDHVILQMTAFESKERLDIHEATRKLASIVTDQLSFNDMLQNELEKKIEVELSNIAFSLKLIDNEVWSSHWDGITVYDKELKLLRTMNEHYSWVRNVALLLDGTLAVADTRRLYRSSKLGIFIHTISNETYVDLAVRGTELYAVHLTSPAIHVYDCRTWHRPRSIITPCILEHDIGPSYSIDLYDHTISVNSTHITLGCCKRKIIYVLDLHGTLTQSHGPDITVITPSISDTEHKQITENITLRGPIICQADDEGAILVVDEGKDRILVLTTEGHWRRVGLSGKTQWYKWAAWLKGQLCVSTRGGKLSMFQ